MKIAVTGANGFIGRHVIPLLIKQGFDVVAIVRKVSKETKLSNECHVIEHEIGIQDDLLFSKLGAPDVLLHLAWGGLPNYKSMYHIDIELPKHYHFIQQMVVSGIRSVAVVGTCFEYGMQSGALSEGFETKPDNPYGYAKDALRKQLQFLQQENDFMLTWMRLFYMYGEDQPENTLYSQFKTAVLNNDPVFNMSGGEQLRDYLSVDDVANKIMLLVSIYKDIGIVNICSGSPVSIRSLVERWSLAYKAEISLNFGYYPYPDYEPMAFWGDQSRFEKIVHL